MSLSLASCYEQPPIPEPQVDGMEQFTWMPDSEELTPQSAALAIHWADTGPAPQLLAAQDGVTM